MAAKGIIIRLINVYKLIFWCILN